MVDWTMPAHAARSHAALPASRRGWGPCKGAQLWNLLARWLAQALPRVGKKMKRSRNSCNGTSSMMQRDAAMGGTAEQATQDGLRRSRRLASKREAAAVAATVTMDGGLKDAALGGPAGGSGASADRLAATLGNAPAANVVVMWEPPSATTTNNASGLPSPEAVQDGGPAGSAQAPATAAADDNAAALRSGLLQSVSLDGGLVIQQAAAQQEADACGLWSLLPDELLEVILRQCTPQQLAQLESTCHFFHDSKLIEKIAKHKLKSVPRARGLRPSRKYVDVCCVCCD